MWRFSFSKRRWPNEWAQVGWLGRQKLARMTSPGEEEGVDRWWRKTMLRVAIPAQTLLHLSTGPKAQCFQIRISCGQPHFWLHLSYLPGHLCQWGHRPDTHLSLKMLCTLLKCFCSLRYIFHFSLISSRGPGAWTQPFRVWLLFSHSSCPTLCNPMDCSTPGFPVLHHLPEFSQTHVHWVGDAIQPSHPVVPFSPALNLSSIRVFSNESAFPIRWPKYWSFSFSISPPNKHSGWFPLGLTGLILLSKGLSRVFSRLFTRVF